MVDDENEQALKKNRHSDVQNNYFRLGLNCEQHALEEIRILVVLQYNSGDHQCLTNLEEKTFSGKIY